MRVSWLATAGLIIVALLVIGAVTLIPWLAHETYGPPAASLTPLEVLEYSARVLWADGLLTRPANTVAAEARFEVEAGESIVSIGDRLQRQGLVMDADAFRDYLIYSGQDTTLQAGQYSLSASMPAIAIAHQMQDATPAEVEFVVLPGWRIEEIALALPSSGLQIAPDVFIRAARSPRGTHGFLADSATAEGFLFPDVYVVPRDISAGNLVDVLTQGFANHLSSDLVNGFAAQRLTLREAVILASIVERETVQPDEAPLIASVYLNRFRAGMHLEADPTVQYAIGFNAVQRTWWTNPLSLADLKVDSPYNTYQVEGLPPSPIANPGVGALQAVAEPASSPYFFFTASCDGGGSHVFSVSFQEHLANLCP